jgi:hypothetical protein
MNRGILVGFGGAAALLVVGAIVFKSGGEPEPDQVPDKSVVKVDADQPSETGSETELVVDLGAAVQVPADVSAFSSTMNLVSRWQDVWESNAVQNLLSIPTVQQMWMQAQQHPVYASFMQTATTDPRAVEGLSILHEALSTEVFVCTGSDLPEVFQAIGELQGELTLMRWNAGLAGVTGGSVEDVDNAEAVNRMIEAVVTNQDRLKLPSVLIGFQLTDADRATQFLDDWLAQVDALPVGAIEQRQIKGTTFYVFEASGDDVPPPMMEQVTAALASAQVTPDASQRLQDFVRGQRINIAAGVLDDYLMLSLGSDTSLLEQWGEGESLASTKMLDPLLARYKDGLASISYTAASMAAQPLTSEDFENIAGNLLAMVPQGNLPPELDERLRKDARMLAGEIAATESHSTLAFSFDNKGIESWSFGGPFPSSLDGSQPLSVMTHRSEQPILLSAARATKSPDSYDQAVKWMKIAFGYFEEFGVPNIPPDERERYDGVMAIALPFLESMDAATRDHLVPAVDGTQSVLLLDGHGEFAGPPEQEPLPQPVPVPRLGVAIELNDAEQFKLAISSYTDATRKLLDDIRELEPTALPPQVAIPDPQTRSLAGGTLYYYPLPVELGPDAAPCALLKDRLLILSSSTRLAEEMTGERPMLTSPVIALDKSAGSVLVLELTEVWDYFHRVGNAAALVMNRRNSPAAQQRVNMMKMQSDVVIRSLSALRSYHSATTEENGLAVNHSWFHIEDIAR